MNEHGRKTLLGMKFSQLLRKIGKEESEESGEELISKAESLARKMWELALGYKEEIWVKDKKSGEMEQRIKQHKPDVAILKELLERLEGKAGVDNKKEQVKTTSEKVREQTKARINALTE
jgi:LPS O-antigen subunit length determinant protein (WzzB/FepE family)